MARLRALLLFFDIVYIFSWGSVTVCLMPFLRFFYALYTPLKPLVCVCLADLQASWRLFDTDYIFCLCILSCLFPVSLDDFLTPLLHLFKRGKKTSQGCETRTPKQIQQVIGDFEAHWQVAGLAESEINAPKHSVRCLQDFVVTTHCHDWILQQQKYRWNRLRASGMLDLHVMKHQSLTSFCCDANWNKNANKQTSV